MVLTKMFEEVVNTTFHSDSRGLATKGFFPTPPVNVLENIQCLYRKSSYQELYTALIGVNKLMKRMQLVEVMLRGFKEVQLFLLSNPDKDCALTDPNLISYALINLTRDPGECMPKSSRSGKRGHHRIVRDGLSSWPTW